MKTKPVHKKGKKRPFRETSLSSKSNQGSENTVKIKQKLKKAKIDNTVQNGDLMPTTEVQAFEKASKKQKKHKIKEKNCNIEKLPKVKVMTNIAEETALIATESKEKILSKKKTKKLKDLKNNQLIGEANKIIPKIPQVTARISHHDIEEMKKRLAEIRSREVISKSARKKAGALCRKIRAAEAEEKSDTVKKDSKNKPHANISVENKEKVNFENKRKSKGEHGKNKKAKIEIKQENQSDEDEDNTDQSNVEEEEEEENAMDIVQGKTVAKRIEDDDDSDQKDDEAVARSKKEVKKKKKEVAQADKSSSSDVSKKGNTYKKRYILFVGNLSHE